MVLIKSYRIVILSIFLTFLGCNRKNSELLWNGSQILDENDLNNAELPLTPTNTNLLAALGTKVLVDHSNYGSESQLILMNGQIIEGMSHAKNGPFFFENEENVVILGKGISVNEVQNLEILEKIIPNNKTVLFIPIIDTIVRADFRSKFPKID